MVSPCCTVSTDGTAESVYVRVVCGMYLDEKKANIETFQAISYWSARTWPDEILCKIVGYVRILTVSLG